MVVNSFAYLIFSGNQAHQSYEMSDQQNYPQKLEIPPGDGYPGQTPQNYPPPGYPQAGPGYPQPGPGYPQQPGYNHAMAQGGVVTNHHQITVVTQPNPPDYMWFACFTTWCCCWPIGIIAVCFSCK